MELDCRSTSASHLRRMVDEILRAGTEAAARQSASRNGTLTLACEEIGTRPAGATDPEAPLVAAVSLATGAVGVLPRFTPSSTDANAPIAPGIPAVAIGAGGEARLTHTVGEWYRNADGVAGVVRAIYALVLSAGLRP